MVLVVIVPIRLPYASTIPPPEDPSWAAAVPPSDIRSIVLVTKVKTSCIDAYTIVGYKDVCISLTDRNCAAYDPITTGVPFFCWCVASGRY